MGGRIVDFPQAHHDGIRSRDEECTLKTVNTFPRFYVAQAGFACAHDDHVSGVKVEVHGFVGGEHSVVVAAQTGLLLAANGLASTGEDTAAKLAKRFGIDITKRKFWEDSLAIISKRVDRYAEL